MSSSLPLSLPSSIISPFPFPLVLISKLFLSPSGLPYIPFHPTPLYTIKVLGQIISSLDKGSFNIYIIDDGSSPPNRNDLKCLTIVEFNKEEARSVGEVVMGCGKLKFVNELSGYELICDCNVIKVDWIEEVNFWVDVKERLEGCGGGGVKRGGGKLEDEDWFEFEVEKKKEEKERKKVQFEKKEEEEHEEVQEMDISDSQMGDEIGRQIINQESSPKPPPTTTTKPLADTQTDSQASFSSTGSSCSCPISNPPLCMIRAQHSTFCHCHHHPLISPLTNIDCDPTYLLRDMIMLAIGKGRGRKELEMDDTLKSVSGGNEGQWKWKLGEFIKGSWIYYDGENVSIKKPD
ncbi:hypothetical protein TrLO_g15285 [Triparma laevis f. longispina]|uniref:Uncharacterized protein n=1 Tax=Triparma laevis f. longispina TaxID=1714387 RepID=A0A9W7KSK6_9STRA|nr:hypothetical protein TrLO_g15285 [Triparma laevis f. longispina]